MRELTDKTLSKFNFAKNHGDLVKIPMILYNPLKSILNIAFSLI